MDGCILKCILIRIFEYMSVETAFFGFQVDSRNVWINLRIAFYWQVSRLILCVVAENAIDCLHKSDYEVKPLKLFFNCVFLRLDFLSFIHRVVVLLNGLRE